MDTCSLQGLSDEFGMLPRCRRDLDRIDYASLANISGWSRAWWIFAREALEDLDRYALPPEQVDVDHIWSMLVKVVFRSGVSPITAADVILIRFGTDTISQHLQRL